MNKTTKHLCTSIYSGIQGIVVSFSIAHYVVYYLSRCFQLSTRSGSGLLVWHKKRFRINLCKMCKYACLEYFVRLFHRLAALAAAGEKRFGGPGISIERLGLRTPV
jgi:hypothetical protein